MKRILVSNNSKILVSFTVAYSLSGSEKVTEIKSGKFMNSLFRFIEIPEQAINVITTIYTIDFKGKKQLLGQDKQSKSISVCYEVYEDNNKPKFKIASCAKFMGAYALYGVNNSSSIVRACILYTVGKEGKYYISQPLKKGGFFTFVTPNDVGTIKVKIEKAKDVSKNIWINLYTEVFSKNPFPMQKCYEVTKPLLKDIQCKSIDCLKL